MRKAYELIDRGICMDILKGYGLVPKMAQLLGHYWENQKIVIKAGKFLVRLFEMGRGVIQGDPASSMIFNILVDAVIRAVLAEVCGTNEAHHRMGWAAV